jgi:cyclopropane-fatty-acyl-phospholipid synthase
MTYSAGIFEHPDATLKQASIAKYDRLCRKLSVQQGDRVVELGCGWGGFAIHAASEYGCHVTGVTLSREQLDYARRRVASLGLDDRIELRLQDYRDVDGTFDKLVSIEMIEAVGHQYLDEFFRVCSSLLAGDGQMALQAITITDQRYAEHLRTVDFMKRYIFPGGCLVSISAVCDATARVTDLRLVDLRDISSHYARTLRRWRDRFNARLEQVRGMGFPERFIRLWEYYLSYCEGAFTERYVGDVQMVFQKPLCRAVPPV